MSNEMAGGVPGAEAQNDIGPALALQNVYLKDCSYEAPNGPRIEGNWNPQINLDLHTAANGIAARSARSGAHRDGLCQAERCHDLPGGGEASRAVSDAQPERAGYASRAVSTICPSVLFPYARAAVSNLVTQGGFPQFLLPPVNFDALYAQSTTQSQPVTTN